MPNPKIQLKFDRKLDKDLAWSFYSNQEFGGHNFWKQGALAHHPKLLEIKSAKKSGDFLDKYISEFYASNAIEIKKLSQKTAGYLSHKQDDFFEVVSEIFNRHPWPRKKFTGCFSIFDFCPRFLDWGGFQVFLYDNRNMQLFTIFHEMLHFIFYDFALKTFPKKFKRMNTDKGKFWDLAEIFNAVVQDTDGFIKLHGKIKSSGYPNHKYLIPEGKKLWKKDQDVSRWINEMMDKPTNQ